MRATRGDGAAVVAVVPTFRPSNDAVWRVATLRQQADAVIVVDDGSGVGADAVLDQMIAEGIEVIRVTRNSGIAHALNLGIGRALELGADFVLNMDQDSSLPPDYVDKALDLFSRSDRVTNLGLAVVGAINGEVQPPRWISPGRLGLAMESIQTGFVMSAECLRECGLLDKRLFIDCVDTEFCLRIRHRGFRIGLIDGVDIEHSLGRQAPLRPFGRQVHRLDGEVETYQYHAPFRRYYIARNNVDLILRYWNLDRDWSRAVMKRERAGMFRAVTSGPHRGAHAVAIAVGTLHGLVRRRGRIPRWLERAVV